MVVIKVEVKLYDNRTGSDMGMAKLKTDCMSLAQKFVDGVLRELDDLTDVNIEISITH
jgi:hypothetical protein